MFSSMETSIRHWMHRPEKVFSKQIPWLLQTMFMRTYRWVFLRLKPSAASGAVGCR